MSDDLEELDLDDLIARFEALDDSHPELLARAEAHLAAPLEDLTLDEALKRFELGERAREVLLADGGWSADLVVFFSHTLARIDPSLRSAFPAINAVIESVGAALPGGALVLGAVLAIGEGPLLSLVEFWLSSRAASIEKARADAAQS